MAFGFEMACAIRRNVMNELLPREIIGLILSEYTFDYFKTPRDPYLFPPVLYVCRLWRSIATSTPECWKSLNFVINPTLEELIASGELEEGITLQESMEMYFSWAKNTLIDFKWGIECMPQNNAYLEGFLEWFVGCSSRGSGARACSCRDNRIDRRAG